MPRGPTIPPWLRAIIAKVHYEHADWSAKEIQNGVQSLAAKDHPSLKPDWPGISAVQKELNRLRKSPDPQDEAWNMLTLSKYELPPEALPAVIRAWVHTRLNSSRNFTIREAKWVARLYCIINDVNQLTNIAHDYASMEYIGEHYRPRFVIPPADYNLFEIMSGQKLSLDQIDKLLDERLKALWESIRNTPWWTTQNISQAWKESTEKGLLKDFKEPVSDL